LKFESGISGALSLSPCGRGWIGGAKATAIRVRGFAASVSITPHPARISLRSSSPPSPARGEGSKAAHSTRRFKPLFGQKAHRGVGIHRFAKGKALRVFAAELVELDRVRIGLRAFGDHVHAEIVG
jgi:hypothetical protein